ncbi:hypothetical protein [Paenibacillus sp. R14(2021)]|uniref:hypothetical protein n=1 Tax=Paenibacillus sp. R14(2021) TaxID=2859228 RepID=UPI001C611A83|nr:hypothetical protein [Paenibacillus sp. R14(2021)]
MIGGKTIDSRDYYKLALLCRDGGILSFFSFMFFSTLEGLAIYAMALYIFRYDFRRFIWHSLVIIELINLQNFLTREEIASLSYIAPIVNLIITVLFLKIIARIPLIGALIMTAVGYAGFILIQATLINSLFSMQIIQTNPSKAHLVQLLTGVIGTFVGWFIYKQGYGYTKDFEKLRFEWEHMLVFVMIIAFMVFLGVMMYFLNVVGSLIGFFVSLVILLLYALRKEREPD